MDEIGLKPIDLDDVVTSPPRLFIITDIFLVGARASSRLNSLRNHIVVMLLLLLLE